MHGENKVPFVDLQSQYQEVKPEVDAAIQEVLDTSSYILGGHVGLFEEAFASFCRVDHAVGVNSGYSAIELALRAYDIGPGDEVITAPSSFIATERPSAASKTRCTVPMPPRATSFPSR